AKVTVEASGSTFELLQRYQNDLRYLFIVSQVALVELSGQVASETGSIRVSVDRAEGEKCERCWNYSTRVGESETYPTVFYRCVAARPEIDTTYRYTSHYRKRAARQA